MKKGQKVEALRGVSFTFPDKGFVFIVGKSGSGKSTMLNILGLLDEYDSGEYLIDGKCSKDLSEAEKDSFRAMNIGFVFQEFHIIEKYTIGQNISLPLEIQQEEKNSGRVSEVLKIVGLEGYENRMPSAISGGQKQRVAIARAIIKKPQIILADEPTGSLDSVTGREIFDILQELSKEKLVIVISHDLESAHKYADKIIELKDGKIDSVYDGDGGAEAVRMVVDEVENENAEQINSLINDGKKVVVSKIKPEKQVEDKVEDVPQRHTEYKKVKLPFKSTMRLSFFSVKSKWVRTFFTILISMFAIAFFGFADLISRFDADNLLLQEMNNAEQNYINIGAEKIEDYGIFKDYKGADVFPAQDAAMEATGLEFYKKGSFALGLPLSVKNYSKLLPTDDHQYYREMAEFYVECDDVSRLGLNIVAGRAPENLYEVMITTYHMQVYELFGFANGETTVDKVTNFSQIEGLELLHCWRTPKKPIRYRIVGLVDVDVSEYKEFSEMTKKVDTLTKVQIAKLNQFNKASIETANIIYVNEGFAEQHEYDYKSVRINGMTVIQFGGIEKTYPSAFMTRINEDIFNVDGHNTLLADNIKTFNDIGDDKIILSVAIVAKFIPEVKNYPKNLRRIEANYNVIGKTIGFNCKVVGPFNTGAKEISREFEIIGIMEAEAEFGAVSQNVLTGYDFNNVGGYKIVASTSAERENVIEKINGINSFNFEEDTFQLFCKTENYSGIRQINIYFTLFVNVFSILALIFCGFAIILTYTFISQSIMLRKKDIGILRSLGARKKDVAGIFVIEGIFIAFLEIVLGSLTCFIGYKFLDKYFITQLGQIAQIYNIVSFTFVQILLMAAATVVAVAVSIFLPIMRISKKQPVDAIRNENYGV